MSAIRETLGLLRIALISWVGVVILDAFASGFAAAMLFASVTALSLPAWVSVLDALFFVACVAMIFKTVTKVVGDNIEQKVQEEVIEDLLRGARMHDQEQREPTSDG